MAVLVALTELLAPALSQRLVSNLGNLGAARELLRPGARLPCWAWRSGEAAALLAGPRLTSPLAPFWQGCAAYASGDEAAAVTDWQRIGGQGYFLVSGHSAFARGEYGTALELYTLATRVDPGLVPAWLGVAAAQMNLATVGKAQWSDMLLSAERALAVAPDDPQAHYLVGYALWLSGSDPRRAEAELRWAVERRGDWGEAYALGRMLLDEGRPSEPARLLQQALAQFENDEVRAQLVRAYLVDGRCAEARMAYQEALTINPGQRGRLQQICQAFPACRCE